MSEWKRKNADKRKTKRIILCVSHLDKVAYQSEIVRPILVGHNIPLPEGWLSDDSGNNISEKNNNYSELTAIYWAWKNLKLSEYRYVGLFHYRRLLGAKYADSDPSSYKSGLAVSEYIDDDSIDALLREYDVVLPMPVNHGPISIAEQYVACHIESDFGVLVSVLIEKYPEYAHKIMLFLYGTKPGLYYPCNMFIMRTEVFAKYCEWMFDVLFEVERRIEISLDVYQARVFGFMSERMMGLFFAIFHPNVNLKTLPFVIQDKNDVLWVNVLYSTSIIPNMLGNDGEAPRLECANADERWSRAEVNSDFDVAVIVRGLDAGEEWTSALKERTMAALEAQWAGPSSIRTPHGRSASRLETLVDSLNSQWLLFLNVGDVCEPSALAVLARHVERHPEWGVVYFDEAQIEENGELANQHFKPDFNLDYLRSLPYSGSAFAVRRDLFRLINGFDEQYDGIEEYDFILRAYEYLGAEGIGHVPGVVVGRAPGLNLSERPLTEVLAAGRQALQAHLARLAISAQVEFGALPATYRIRYLHDEARPRVSIVIPVRNQRRMLERCLESLLAHTAWPNYEILIVDNGSDEPDALQYLEGLKRLSADLGGKIQVLDYPYAFNCAAMNNLAAAEARGEYLLLLNSDTAALHDEWLDAMMAHAQRPEVGVVGAKLMYPNGTVQHAGAILGMKGPADSPFNGHEASSPGYYARLQVDQDYSAVSGACLLVRKSLFDEVGGFDADELAVSYSDIDLCLKIRERGKLVVWTPHALLLHEGGKSQKGEVEAKPEPLELERFAHEQAVMYQRWMPQIANDPAYNRCLSLASADFLAEPDPALCWDPEWRPAPRVITQPADRMGCGEYRIIAPTRALINAGRIQGQETDRIYTPAELARIKPDTLVLQRQVEPHQIEAIERHKRFNDVFCVFEIDDLITNLPVKNAHKKYLSKDIYKRFRRAAGACDRLVVATEPLAEAYRDLSADVRVVPNFIEEARWGELTSRRRVSDKPRVGWAGGVSHTGDLEMIASVVEELKDEVEWVFFGMCPERLRPFVREVHQPVPIDHYPKRLADLNLDLAVAPLEDVPFNHAKSHLRLLEYGILGYPVVCSDLTPYRGDFPVARVRNRYRDWVDAIREHVSDLDAAAAQGDALRDHVRKLWLLENNLDVWLEGWLP